MLTVSGQTGGGRSHQLHGSGGDQLLHMTLCSLAHLAREQRFTVFVYFSVCAILFNLIVDLEQKSALSQKGQGEEERSRNGIQREDD